MADLTRIQKDFAAHLRDPDSVPAPEGIEDRRMAVYRELIFNNVRELLAGTFPVCSAILGPGRWSRLVAVNVTIATRAIEGFAWLKAAMVGIAVFAWPMALVSAVVR